MEHNDRLAPESAIHSRVVVPEFQLDVARHADSDVLWTTTGRPSEPFDDEVAEMCKQSSSDDLWPNGITRFDTAVNIVNANLKGRHAKRSVSATNDVLVLTALAPWLALVAIKVATVALAAAGPLASAFGFAFAGAAS